MVLGDYNELSCQSPGATSSTFWPVTRVGFLLAPFGFSLEDVIEFNMQ
jgi:hypothetical protein